jgi:hypothetical protein
LKLDRERKLDLGWLVENEIADDQRVEPSRKKRPQCLEGFAGDRIIVGVQAGIQDNGQSGYLAQQ